MGVYYGWRRKPISVKGPAYTEGSLESKYEILSEIGASACWIGRCVLLMWSGTDVFIHRWCLVAGHGGTSVVYRCQNRRTGNVHACKIIDRRMIQQTHNVLMEQFQVRSAVDVDVHNARRPPTIA